MKTFSIQLAAILIACSALVSCDSVPSYGIRPQYLHPPAWGANVSYPAPPRAILVLDEDEDPQPHFAANQIQPAFLRVDSLPVSLPVNQSQQSSANRSATSGARSATPGNVANMGSTNKTRQPLTPPPAAPVQKQAAVPREVAESKPVREPILSGDEELDAVLLQTRKLLDEVAKPVR